MTRWRYLYACTVLVALAVASGLWNPMSRADAIAPHVPRYQVDPSWPKPLPDKWVTGEPSGTCVDPSNDHVFTVNRLQLVSPETLVARPSPAIIEYDTRGNVVNAGPTDPAVVARLPGTSPPNGIHGCFVDYQGNVWVAGNGDGIVLKLSHDLTTILLQIGTKGVCDSPTGACGNVQQKGDSRTLLNQPADVYVDPDRDPVTGLRGSIYIADGYGNHRVVVFDAQGNWLRDWGGVGTGPGLFTSEDGGHPHCVVIGRDDLVYACDRGQDRIHVFTKTGAFVREIPIVPGTGVRNVYDGATGIGTAGSAWDVDFSSDSRQTFLFDTDGGNEVFWTLDRATGTILAGFGRPGHQAGEFTFLHTLAVDRRGNIITGETVGGRRIQKFVRRGNLRDDDLEVLIPNGNPVLRLPHYDPVPR